MVDETKSNAGSRINRLPSAYIKPVEIQVQPTGSESTFAVPQLGKATSTEPSVINNAEPDNTVTLGESFVAGLAPTGRDIGEALYSKMHFDVDPMYNPDDDFAKFEDTYNGTRNPQEIQLLIKSRSAGEFQYNTERIMDLRDRQDKQAANPISGAVGGVFDIDAPIAIASGGVGAAAKVGVGAARTISATTAGLSMAALNSATVNQSYRTDTDRLADVLVATAGGAFAVRNPKPLTTQLEPTSPSSTVQTAGVLPEAPISSQSIPLPTAPKPNFKLMSEVGTDGKPRYKYTPKTVDEMVDEELDELGVPDKDTIKVVPIDGTNIKLSNTLDSQGNEIQFPKLSIENRYAAAVQSAADDMFHYTKGDPDNPLNYILASPYTSGDDAVSHGVAVLRDGEFRLVDFEQSIVKATKELHGTGGLLSRLFQRDHNQALKQTSMDIYTEMQKLDQVVIAHQKATGEVLDKAAIISLIDDTTNPDVIKASMKSYIDSDFAVNMYDHIKRVGMMDEDALEQIVRRPTYMPVKQSYDQVKTFIEGDLVDVAKRRVVVAKFLGDQIFDMYNGLKQGIRKADGTTIRLTSHQLGEKFLDNMKARAQNPNTVQTVGLPKEELHDILTRQGVDPDEASALVNKMTEQRSNQQGVANLRQRIAWDFNKTATTPDGVTFSMRDLVDQNSFQNVVDYNRRMSKRVGLAQYGFKDRNALQTAKAAMLDNLPEGANRAKATAYIDNVINAALGNPVGEAVPDWVRSMNTIAGSILLSGSGLYNAIEAGVQIQRIGMLRSFPQLLTGMKPMFRTVSSYSKAEATTLHDALLGKLMSTDRWQNIMTHYSDDFSIEGGFHEAVQYYGQSTRFLNGSEHIKRWQLGMFAGVFVDAFRGASKGLANDVKFLKEGLKFSDELLDKTTAQFKLHGDNIDGWDADIRIAMEQKVFHEADNLAHTVHHGEVPSFMEYSSVGKIIFPFMRYLFAMQQKILRRTYIRDGAAGIAMVLAVQFPLAMMVANTKRAMSGEKPYDLDNPDDLRDFMRSTVNGLSGLGTFSYPLDVILSGGQNMGSVVTLAPVGRVLGMGEDIITGNADLTTIKEGTPANTILAINLLYAALNDEE